MKLKHLTTLILLISVISNGYAQIEKKLKTEEDGYQWYLISDNKTKGVQDINGKEIVPLSNYYYEKYDHGFFRCMINTENKNYYKSKCDYYNNDGCKIISSDKYDSAFYRSEDTCFLVYKNDKI